MRIGIVPGLNPKWGGLYQYSLTMLHAQDESRNGGGTDEFVAFVWDVRHSALDQLKSSRWTVNSLQPQPGNAQAVDAMLRVVDDGPDSVKLRPDMHRWFRASGVDLMIYPVPDPLSFEAGVPYVMAIHDLQHRLQPDFTEVSADGEWESREYLFSNGSGYETLLL